LVVDNDCEPMDTGRDKKNRRGGGIGNMEFNPDAPGVEKITQGFGQLLKSGYSDVPGLLERYAELLEIKMGLTSLNHIERGAKELNLSGANAPWTLRFMANSVRCYEANRESKEIQELEAYPGGATVIDIRTRKRVDGKDKA